MKILQQMEKQRLRIERIFCLGAQAIDETIPESLQQAIDEDLSGIAHVLSIPAKKLSQAVRDGTLLALLRDENKLNWLVECATPVQTKHASGTSSSYSWGYTHAKWFYADSLEQCVEQAFMWQSQKRAEAA